MKKLLWALGGLLVLCVLAVVVVPTMINWNAYKQDIADEVKKATGRDLVIAGDITVDLLPAPALKAEQVSLSSIEGAQSPDLVALKFMEVRIALAPLLGGKIRVEKVRLVEPQVFLEVLADGRVTWNFSRPDQATSATESPAASNGSGGGSGPAVILDQFELVDGTLIYQDASSGSLEEIRDMDLNVAAASLTSGPYRASGSLIARGVRFGIDADVGAIVEGRTFPLDVALRVGGDSAEIRLSGTVLGLGETARFRGDLSVDSGNIGNVVKALTEGTELPEPLQQPFKLSGAIDASETSLAVDKLTFDIGGAKGTGKVSGTLGNAPKVNAQFSIDRIDADPWLKPAPAKTANAGTPGQESAPAAPKTTPTATVGSPSGFSLPDGVNVTLATRIGEVSMRGDVVRNVIFNAELANGELTLSQASLQGPGGADIAVFGVLGARDNKPSFDASFDVKVKEPRRLMDWLEVDASFLKSDKPGSLALAGRVGGTPTDISVHELKLAFDKTTVRGAATLAIRERLGIGASVSVDQLDLDAYLQDAPTKEAKPDTAPGSDNSKSPVDTAAQQPAGPFDALKVLADFDTNIRATVGSLKTEGIPIRDVDADISLVGGNLTIRKLNVGNVAGVGLAASGVLKGLNEIPVADKLALRAGAADLSGLASLTGINLPVPAKTIGKVEFLADVNGRLDTPTVSSTLTAMAATLIANGTLKPFDLSQMYDVGVGLKHPDVAALMKRLDTGYTPSGKIGDLNLSTRLKGGVSQLAFSDLTAIVGAAKIGGQGTVDLDRAVPHVNATLTTGPLIVDPFLPAQKSAALDLNEARVIPATLRLPEGMPSGLKHLIVTVSERWSRDPIDLSALRSVNADVNLTSPSVSYHEYKLENADVVSKLSDGVLRVEEFKGTVFNGRFTSAAVVDASKGRPTLAGKFSVGAMDIGAASAAAGIAGGSGRLTTTIETTTEGSSIADWIGSLGGKGAIEIRGIKGQQSLSDMPVVGLVLGPLLQVFEVLNSGLGSLLGAGGKTGIGETDVSSAFTITNGVVTTKDTKIISNLYEGTISGDVNLPLWSMNVGGNLAVDQGLVGTLLANVARIPSKIPFQVTGNIDKPNVKIQSFGGSASEGGEGIKIPGIDKLEKKAPGVGSLLQGILGGGSTKQQAPAPQPSANEPPPQTGSGSSSGSAPPAQQQQPQQQQDPINQLLRGLIR